ncbi:hypothetical protein J4Q44_G00128110 [Coregonus suidteri]|uniref:L27 domain-containing protein n=1 Tax=Coregonus suidteri TaxID=861788 RepID=A0AAN8M4U5_9TELE
MWLPLSDTFNNALKRTGNTLCYWSKSKSPIRSQHSTMPVRKEDTARALGLLEDYCAKLKKPEEQQLKTAIQRVMGVFKSSLFQALLDIQEFYEVTLLNTQKSCEQKLEEVNQMADKWEQTGTGSPTTVLQHTCPTEMRERSSSEPSGKDQTPISVKVSEFTPFLTPSLPSYRPLLSLSLSLPACKAVRLAVIATSRPHSQPQCLHRANHSGGTHSAQKFCFGT